MPITGIDLVTAPPIFRKPLGNTCPKGIPMNVETHGCKVTVIFYKEALKAPLKQMSGSLMLSVVPDSITDLKPLDSPGKIGLLCADEQMKVVLHEHISMHLYPEPVHHLTERLKKSEVILLIPKDFLPFISPGQHVVKGVRIIYSNWPSHECIIPMWEFLSRKK
jgi:hypothetical protein